MPLKLNNKSLGIVFILLLIIVVILFFFESGKNERTFREELVNIDTSSVSQIIIHSKLGKTPVRIFRKGEDWNVELVNGSIARVPDQKISQMFQEMTAIKPKRLAARGEDKWNAYQVDSTGTRVEVFEGDDLTLDLVIGRFNYQQQPRNISTYVRLNNDTDVYEVDGFLSVTFNQNPDSYRDGTIIKGDSNNWTQLQFQYPADSSFTLIKNNGKWFVDGVQTDSVKTANYLRTVSNLTRNSFADTVEVKKDNPTYKLSITDVNLEFIQVNGFVDEDGYTIISSQNPDTKFDGKTFGNTLFVGKNHFFK